MITTTRLRSFFGSFVAALTLLVASLSAHAQYSIVHSFAGAPNDAAFPNGELIQDTAGNFYGTTYLGGTSNFGTVFKIDPSGNETVLYNFKNGRNDGNGPLGGLLLDTEGNLYGTTTRGGELGGGVLFELDAGNAFRRIFEFGQPGIGSGPQSKLVTINGDFYGVTPYGGLNLPACQSEVGQCGIIYKMTKGGTETVLYYFTGEADGAYPQTMIRDAAGNLYGVATSGTNRIGGTVWKLNTGGAFTVLYTFTGGADGGYPLGRLIRDSVDGSLRGTTEDGGDPECNCGVVFRLDTSGNEKVIHKFLGGSGGLYPSVVGLLDVGGVLYGTTDSGGDMLCDVSVPNGCGVLYQIGKTGQYTVLHRFAGPPTDGALLDFGSLTLGMDGSIYGATREGGTGTGCATSNQCGTIFKYTP